MILRELTRAAGAGVIFINPEAVAAVVPCWDKDENYTHCDVRTIDGSRYQIAGEPDDITEILQLGPERA